MTLVYGKVIKDFDNEYICVDAHVGYGNLVTIDYKLGTNGNSSMNLMIELDPEKAEELGQSLIAAVKAIKSAPRDFGE